MAVTVDVVKSVAGLYKHMVNGELALTGCFVDIDGDCEVGAKEVVCHKLCFKECQVKVRNLKITSLETKKDGKCLELEGCQGALVEGCTFFCLSSTSDMAPYPARQDLAVAISCVNSSVKIKECSVIASGLDARGLVVEAGSLVDLVDSEFSETFNSAVWCHGEESKCSLTNVVVKRCGGYGALYCSHGARLEASRVEQGKKYLALSVFHLIICSRRKTHVGVESSSYTATAGCLLISFVLHQLWP